MLDDSNVLDALRILFAIVEYPVGLSLSALLFALLCRDPDALVGLLLGRGVEGGTGPGTDVVPLAEVNWPLAVVGIGGSVMSPEQEDGRNS